MKNIDNVIIGEKEMPAFLYRVVEITPLIKDINLFKLYFTYFCREYKVKTMCITCDGDVCCMFPPTRTEEYIKRTIEGYKKQINFFLEEIQSPF